MTRYTIIVQELVSYTLEVEAEDAASAEEVAAEIFLDMEDIGALPTEVHAREVFAQEPDE